MVKSFYHGTTDSFMLNNVLLPATETGNLRESFRLKNRDVVFVTTSLPAAIKYAYKAANEFGGNPIVYKVKPINYWQNNLTEYICRKAIIIDQVTIWIINFNIVKVGGWTLVHPPLLFFNNFLICHFYQFLKFKNNGLII